MVQLAKLVHPSPQNNSHPYYNLAIDCWHPIPTSPRHVFWSRTQQMLSPVNTSLLCSYPLPLNAKNLEKSRTDIDPITALTTTRPVLWLTAGRSAWDCGIPLDKRITIVWDRYPTRKQTCFWSVSPSSAHHHSITSKRRYEPPRIYTREILPASSYSFQCD